jgi:hypothetical protein
LIELMQLGLSFADVRRLGYEEALCLLWHAQYRRQLSFIEREAQRIASLTFPDAREQSIALERLELRARTLRERFHRSYSCPAAAPKGT